MTKTDNSDTWSLYKGSIIFDLITHDTGRFSWKRKNQTTLWMIFINLYSNTYTLPLLEMISKSQ